jgi:hypothetical protein
MYTMQTTTSEYFLKILNKRRHKYRKKRGMLQDHALDQKVLGLFSVHIKQFSTTNKSDTIGGKEAHKIYTSPSCVIVTFVS